MLQKTNKKYYFYSFLLSVLCAAVFIIPGILMGKGTFYMAYDYNYQQVPFNMNCNQAIKDGNIFWADNFDLGTGFIGAYSFYTIGSPFFWLSLVLPSSAYAVALPFLLILKYGVAGLGAFAYIRRYLKNPNWALVGSLLYAFSGYQIANINYNHFHDVTALFPFLLLALDETIENQRRGWLALMVGLCAVTNYFFFIGTVVFVVIYFVVKLISGQYGLTKRLFLKLAFECVCGVGLAAVLFVPSILFIFANPRSTDNIFSLGILKLLFLKPHQYADILHGLLLPAESIMSRGFILAENPTAPELWLPLFGIVPAAAYCWNNRKSWLSRCIGVCAVCMLVPVLNSVFVAFNLEYYTRWFYMPILLLALASAKALEEKELSLRSGFVTAGVLYGLFFVCYLLWKYYFKVEFLPNRLLAFVLLAVAIGGLVCTAFAKKISCKRYGISAILIGVMGFAAVNGVLNIYYTHKYWQSSSEGLSAQSFFEDSPTIAYPQQEEYYRTDTMLTWLNTGLTSDKPSINLFGSTVSGSIFDFYHACGYSRTVNSILPQEAYGFRSLLSVKYIVSSKAVTGADGESYNVAPDMPGISESCHVTGGVALYENYNYIPMGFTFDNAISESEFAKTEKEEKHLVLLKALVLPDEQVTKYAKLLPVITQEALADTSYEAFEGDVAKRQSQSGTYFSYDNGKYTSRINLDKDNLVFYSIPYDKGWRATVNGQEADIIKADYGFMAVAAAAGENEIVFTYTPQGLYAGLIISVICGVLLLLYLTFYLNKKEKCKNDGTK
ncbi:MAG: YfhO family protein [Oscillospiraceae bacterium]|nr:YfhO family protein [Oscillospiraceae bacterium]